VELASFLEPSIWECEIRRQAAFVRAMDVCIYICKCIFSEMDPKEIGFLESPWLELLF
jgi:hypothetical protein